MSRTNTDLQWKTIPGFSKYEVSNYGDIIHTESAHIKSPTPKGQGNRLAVWLRADDGSDNTQYVHRLVAAAFLESYDSDMTVEFIDGNITHVGAYNLCVGRKGRGGRKKNDNS